ncbi:MAG: hypothetical protein ABI759_18200 [Candidatus Solibacter sp.]
MACIEPPAQPSALDLMLSRAGKSRYPRPSHMLFLLACWVGMLQLIYPVGYGFGNGYEMSSIGKNLAEHGVFGNPFAPFLTGPTAVVPPLHPFLLGLIYRFFPGPPGGFIVTIANILANALIAALMPWLALLLCRRQAPGIFAGLLWLPAMRLMPQWDAGFTLAALVLFAVLTAEAIGRGKVSLGAALLAGVAGGLISLANPATVMILGLWVLFLLVAHKHSTGAAMRFLATFALAVALCNLPWALRNYGIWHAFALRTNFGMTLYSSNNDCAESSLSRDGQTGCYQQTHPVASPHEIALLTQLGEVEFDRDRTTRALAWIRSHPRRFLALTRARMIEFWFPEPGPPSYTMYAIWMITALSLPGVCFMARHRLPVVWFLGVLWLVYPLMYYIMVSSDRYRYPVIWTSLLPAGYLLAVLWSKLPWIARRTALAAHQAN